MLALWSMFATCMVAAQPLQPPSLRCASVNIAGDVTLTWVVPPDPNGLFQEYRIYGAAAVGGPYALLGTVPLYAQTTYFHAGAGAHLGPRYYHVTTVSTGAAPNVSEPSDTLATMFLEVAQSTPLGSAVISWSPPVILPSSQDISIWQEYPVGNWTLVGTVTNTATSYSHVIAVCADSLTFRIGLADESGCTSFSSRDGDDFEDATPPSSPVVVSVTVDTLSGLSNLSWDPSPEGDTDGYIILLVTPGGGIIIDTLYGHFNTSYEWAASTPDIGPESFTVAAFDTCWTGVPPSPNTSPTLPPHTTNFLTTGYDLCASTVLLQWSGYIGWEPVAYQVLVQVDDGLWNTVAYLAGDARQYAHAAIPGRDHCYVVKAVHEDGQAFSLSNRACRFANYPAVPQFNYIRTVTVTGPSEILVVDSVDMNAAVRSYTLERSDNGGPWQPIAFAAGHEGPVIVFADPNVDPATIGYRYRVQVEDSCGTGFLTSNIGGNIILRATPDLRNLHHLDWNGYADWAGSTIMHTLFRSVSDAPFEEYMPLPPMPWSYTDNVYDLIRSTGKVCYYIQAVEAGNPSGINATSESNVACAVQEDLVFIPNAFIIGGFNPIFKPVIGYVDVSEYEFSIMNRWGQVIWTTSDRDEGWNGTVGSQTMPTGVYAYYCSFHKGDGQRIEKRGHVTLLTAEGN